MPYMIEYTLFATLAFHHLGIGLVLLLLVFCLNRFLIQDAELKSWMWMSAFVLATITPILLIDVDEFEYQGVTSSAVIDSTGGSTSSQNTTVQAFTEQDRPLEAQKLIKSKSSWHFPAAFVFENSILISVLLVVWWVGSLWRISTLSLMWIRTRHLLSNKGRQHDQYSAYIDLPVYISKQVSSPMVLGYFKNAIILPNTITETLNQPQILAILQHEKAHIVRKDNFFALFQEVLAILFWWSPVMRVLNKNIHIYREIACDLRAAYQCNCKKQYAQSLLDCAKLMVHQHRSVLAMGLFTKKKELSNRIGLVLSQASSKRSKTSVIVAVCAVFSISVVHASQALAPKINIQQTTKSARHYSILPSDDGQALISAVMRNDIDTIRALQRQGVDIDTPALGDGTALMIAVKSKNLQMANALLDLGADVNQSSRGDGNPLIVAAMMNNLEAAELLLNRGADVNEVVPNDETALINASFYGHIEMAELLINRGADLNVAVTTSASDGNEIRTALNRASKKEMRDLLMANGAVQ